MQTLEIRALTGPAAISTADGDRVATQIAALIEQGESVELDFAGVDLVATSFLNHAIGALLGQFPEPELARRVNYRGLQPESVHRLRRVVDNARRYFSESGHAKAVDRALEEVSAGA